MIKNNFFWYNISMLNERIHKDVVWYDFLEPTEEIFLPLAKKIILVNIL